MIEAYFHEMILFEALSCYNAPQSKSHRCMRIISEPFFLCSNSASQCICRAEIVFFKPNMSTQKILINFLGCLK